MKNKFFQKLVLGLAFFTTIVFGQKNIIPTETEYKGVYDYANLLSPTENQQLTDRLIQYSLKTSTQIAIVSIPSLEGNEIAMLATETAHAWGLGQKGKDNGILILIAKKERKMFIANGYGVEHLLTDYLSKEIIEDILKPAFKQQQFYQGLDEATTRIIKIMGGTYKADPKSNEKGFPIGNLIILGILIIAFIILMNKKNGGNHGGNRGNRGGGLDAGDLLTAFWLGSLGRNSGGFGGNSSGFGSGGGFSGGGFGGGGFGGGGAGGDW